MSRETNAQKVERWLALLEERLGCSHPVVIGDPLPADGSDAGTCNFARGKYVLRFREGLRIEQLGDTLCHEYAHAREWPLKELRLAGHEDHDAHYWIEHGMVWRTFLAVK